MVGFLRCEDPPALPWLFDLFLCHFTDVDEVFWSFAILSVIYLHMYIVPVHAKSSVFRLDKTSQESSTSGERQLFFTYVILYRKKCDTDCLPRDVPNIFALALQFAVSCDRNKERALSCSSFLCAIRAVLRAY